MGNKASTETVLKQYDTLINMGFDEQMSMEAAKKYPNPKSLLDAIEYMSQQQNINDESKHNDVTKGNELNRAEPKNTEKQSVETLATLNERSAMERIIDALKFYQKNNALNNDKLSEYLIKNCKQLINDYHYILENTLNEDNIPSSEANTQFAKLYNELVEKNGLLCDITKCNIYLRNNRERETQLNECNDKHLLTYINILDSIHCYFVHSVDVGYRILHKLDNESVTQVDSIGSDLELSRLKSYLHTKRQKLRQTRGTCRFQNNKFMTQIAQKHEQKVEMKNNNNNDEDQQENEDIQYSFGKWFDYWSDSRFKAKYQTLKHELLNNKIFTMTQELLEAAFDKAEFLLKHTDKIKRLNCCGDYSDICGIKSNRPITIDNILSILLYTDYDTLSFKFSSTFRKLEINETFFEVQRRNQEYFHWSKLLCETVNCYGNRVDDTEINVFYHGVSLLYFTKFIAEFNAPTSTTTKLQIATVFAKTDGIILELHKCYECCSLRYFNCSFISDFGNEEERLFIQPPRCFKRDLKFVSIRNMSTDENYKGYIKSLTLFQKIIDYKKHKLPDNLQIDVEYIDNINKLILSAINQATDTEQSPNYILKCFQKWARKIKTIAVSFHILNKHCKKLKILHGEIDNLLCFDKVNIIFENLEEIKCWSMGDITVNHLTALLPMLQSINSLKYSKLNKIELYGALASSNIVSYEFMEEFGAFSDLILCDYQKIFNDKKWIIQQKHKKVVLSSNLKT
eukprot:152977_1